MAIAKAERLMNLALCLLGTRRPLSKRELRDSIEAYVEAFGPGNGATGSDDSFNRMFERDKDDLRELGLVIETVESLDGDIGYLARRDSNRLPPITLDAEEAAALGVAAKVWQQARLMRRGQRRAAEAARGGPPRGCRPLWAARRSGAADPRARGGVRAADARLPGPPPRCLRLPQGHRRPARAAARGAVGSRVLARSLVPRGLGPRPGRRAGLPAVPDHRQGPLARRPVHRSRAGRRHRP